MRLVLTNGVKLMLKRQAAELLGVTPARVSQLIRDGYLKPSPDGSITAAAVEHCRRHAPIAWQVSGLKSGRRSAAQAERERLDRLWYAVASKMVCRGKQVAWAGLQELAIRSGAAGMARLPRRHPCSCSRADRRLRKTEGGEVASTPVWAGRRRLTAWEA